MRSKWFEESVVKVNTDRIENNKYQIKKIELYDVTGRLLKTEIVNTNNFILNISDLEKATFILKIQTENNTQTIKIIKN